VTAGPTPIDRLLLPFATCWLAERAGVAVRPDGLRWSQVAAARALAGIGFTMAIFIGALAFDDRAVQETAKLAVLAASAAAALIGGLAMRRPLPHA